jgi:hypothetical protein
LIHFRRFVVVPPSVPRQKRAGTGTRSSSRIADRSFLHSFLLLRENVGCGFIPRLVLVQQVSNLVCSCYRYILLLSSSSLQQPSTSRRSKERRIQRATAAAISQSVNHHDRFVVSILGHRSRLASSSRRFTARDLCFSLEKPKRASERARP